MPALSGAGLVALSVLVAGGALLVLRSQTLPAAGDASAR
jgi:hypothetical protein